MKLQIPEFVFRHGANNTDWIEEHDALQNSDSKNPFDQKNKEDWWLQNYKIRKLFDSIENEVKLSIKSGVIPSIRVASWSHLAKILKCDRATLKHQKRYAWTKTRKENIEKIINNCRTQALSLAPETPNNEIELVKERLNKQRDETIFWFDKCKGLESLVKELYLYIENQKATIEGYEKIINQLPNLDQNSSLLEAKIFNIHRNSKLT